MAPPPDTDAEAEALRLKATAESKFKASNNAKSTLKYAKRAHRLCPHLPGVSETVAYATGTATDGGSPSWNERLVVEVPAHARSVTLEVKCKNTPGVKDVGVARIVVEDILGGAAAGSNEEHKRFLSYALRESLHVSWQESRKGMFLRVCLSLFHCQRDFPIVSSRFREGAIVDNPRFSSLDVPSISADPNTNVPPLSIYVNSLSLETNGV